MLVHGDPSLIPLEASFPEAAEIADQLVYTGYVGATGEPPGPQDGVGAGEVLVSAGGGAFGGALLTAALTARRQGCFADRGWRLLTGPNLAPAEFAVLTANLPDGVVVERYEPDFSQVLRRCRVSVSQAGYNALEVLAAGVAAVFVPFDEMLQPAALRTERLATRGVVEMVAHSS